MLSSKDKSGFSSQFSAISDALQFHRGNHSATFKEFQIFSAFQPIFSITHKRVVGLEGLVRAVDLLGKPVSPWQLFNSIKSSETVLLDQLCQTIHIDNFRALGLHNSWVFLNICPETLNNHTWFAAYLSSLLNDRGIPAENIVIEVLETDIDNEQGLEAAVRHYKKLGCLIAIDDFGAGHSNFQRIWRLQPDIVKFDRSMVQRAGADRSVQTMMKGIVSLLHANKCIVLAEGVETLGEALACMDANVDLVQGFYFCRPTPISDGPEFDKALWPTLYNAFDIFSDSMRQQHSEIIKPYKDRFASIIHLLSLKAKKLKLTTSIQTCAESMFTMDRVIRLYAITEDGNQSGENIVSPRYQSHTPTRLTPLSRTEGATWRHRPYFYRAMENPGEVQVTRPYFSIPDAGLCVTLSLRIDNGDQISVICCDIDWGDNKPGNL